MHDEIPVEVTQDNSTTLITINRPTARNALDAHAVTLLKEAFRHFDADDSSKVAILHGRGGAFCAGADLKQVAKGANYEPWAGSLEGMLGAPLSKPIIAAVEGHAVAGGLGVALYCDIRVADETAVFGVFCRRFGVPMSDGTTVRLPRLIGEARAMTMMLTGRAVKAREALDFGLVSEVVATGQALARAKEIAATLAKFPQLAMLSDRRSLLESRGLPLEAALIQENELAQSAKAQSAASGAARFAAGEGRHGAKTP